MNPGRDITDLIEENRSLVCGLESPITVFYGSGKGTLDVAEQLSFQEVLSQSRAVYGNERFILSFSVKVQRPGDQLLTGAIFTSDQYGGVQILEIVQQVVDFLHLHISTNDFLVLTALNQLQFQVSQPGVIADNQHGPQKLVVRIQER